MGVSRDQARYLWSTSWFSIVSAIYGLSRGHRIAIMPLIVFLTSLNYWRNPFDRSMRRFVDVMAVLICATCQIYLARNLSNYSTYIKLSIIGFAFYPIARLMKYHKHPWKSVISHSVMHVVCNVANIVLYSSPTDEHDNNGGDGSDGDGPDGDGPDGDGPDGDGPDGDGAQGPR